MAAFAAPALGADPATVSLCGGHLGLMLAGRRRPHVLTPLEFLSSPYFLVGGDIAEMTEPDDEASTAD
jgi:hypothetical protein